mmetsp:Transcript_107500/g.131163  ORF Transcript_107500/g.131163 Transcript_107500/m.131163 type:complete len:427 (-) Transcript_107500:69-1349(-)
MLFQLGVILAVGLRLSQGACDGCEREDSVLLQQQAKGPTPLRPRKLKRAKVVSLTAQSPEDDLKDYTFEDYVASYGKKYDAKEYKERKTIFEKQMKEVIEHNANPHRTFDMGVNDFTDWKPEELKKLRGLTKNRAKTGEVSKASKEARAEAGTAQVTSWDWRYDSDDVVVTPVKNQGHCGSCWAFAATATVESAVAIATGLLTILAPQPMVSCAANPRHCGGTGGCDGATAQIGFEFVKNSTLTYEEVVGYKSYWGQTGACTDEMKGHFSMYPVVSISGHVTNPTNDYEALVAALVTHGPQAISVDASHWSPYQSGIANFCDVDTNVEINHAAVLMGYGVEDDLKYWTVRNSWGTLWGEDGYIRLIRHDDEGSYCGWDKTPSHGSLCEDESDIKQQWVCGTCGILFDTSYVVGANYVGMGEGDVNR